MEIDAFRRFGSKTSARVSLPLPGAFRVIFFFFRYFLSGALLEVVFASKNLGKTARHDPAREKPGRAGRAAREITMPRDTRNPRVITSRSGPAATDGSSGNDNLHFSGTPLERRTREHAPLFLPR